MPSTVKRSITLEEDLDLELTERFPPGDRSRFINDATRIALAQVRLRELVDEMVAADGTADEEMLVDVGRLPLPE